MEQHIRDTFLFMSPQSTINDLSASVCYLAKLDDVYVCPTLTGTFINYYDEEQSKYLRIEEQTQRSKESSYFSVCSFSFDLQH